MKSFYDYHPFVIFLYFFAVIGLTMFYMQPVLLIISFSASIILALFIDQTAFFKTAKWLVPFMFIAALINPLMTHDGELIILYVNHRPITVEAIVFGFAMSIMLLAVIFWFTSFNKLMSSDKFLYLFGKISPAVALLISVTMRLIPRFIHQITVIAHAQKTIGMDATSGSLWQRLRSLMRIISILISWALENAIETADSMKARGYGLKNRTTFHLFKFDRYDGIVTACISVLFLMQVMMSYLNWTHFDYYPTFTAIELNTPTILVVISYTILVCIPIIIEIQEALKWRSLKSTT
ncbi:energy-coupling factor transporter transmembrane component T [Kurthia sibirica]|uniref:Cobalt ABC transporter permease n=1 Tax=Kurthia sibirica TaxID=202750 RepID=A0A2U3ANH3_9BACL|nr:energy-coupling factor transporter transmembrane component T [Kurthia sibirica]PWI26082.1 cobalt ABC transporter permease [Kurthia sibirica]GEK34276.1 cobalt transporter [Kurthia sibirica]